MAILVLLFIIEIWSASIYYPSLIELEKVAVNLCLEPVLMKLLCSCWSLDLDPLIEKD